MQLAPRTPSMGTMLCPNLLHEYAFNDVEREFPRPLQSSGRLDSWHSFFEAVRAEQDWHRQKSRAAFRAVWAGSIAGWLGMGLSLFSLPGPVPTVLLWAGMLAWCYALAQLTEGVIERNLSRIQPELKDLID
jgi:hypothetical protein